ncbi:MAG: hypothetical protein AABY53_06575 [Bdellovibrionota bacterium]
MNFTTKLTLVIGLVVSMSVFAQTSEMNSTDGGGAESFFSKNQKFDDEGIELYNSNLDLKRHKKIGAGISVGGAGGALGLNSELNLDAENALVVGLGTGPNYGSFNLLYKRNLESNYLSPYGKLGYSKWFSASKNTSSVGSSDILRQIFSEQDLKSGKFDTDFMVTSLGAEYNQLEGEYSGVNFYGELVILTEIKSAKVVPTGAIGITYFY